MSIVLTRKQVEALCKHTWDEIEIEHPSDEPLGLHTSSILVHDNGYDLKIHPQGTTEKSEWKTLDE